MTREDRILQIVSQYPGLTAVAIEWSLLGDYRFKWFGRMCEFGKLYPALMRLELSGKIMSSWESSEFPRRRVYHAVQRMRPTYVREP